MRALLVGLLITAFGCSTDELAQPQPSATPQPTRDPRIETYCEVYDETEGEMDFLRAGDNLKPPQRREYLQRREMAAPGEIDGDWANLNEKLDGNLLLPSVQAEVEEAEEALLDYTQRVCGFS